MYEQQTEIESRCVKDMPSDEQPREKFERYGAESLSDAELLAILLRTGNRTHNVIDMSRRILDHFGGLPRLCRRKWEELRVISGIGNVKAITLEASFELARRIEVADMREGVQLTSPDAAARYFSPKLRDLEKEVFIIAMLNNKRMLTTYKKISVGGKRSTIVDVSEVMREAILCHASSIVVLHNHPSGNRKPSKADIRLTKRIMKSGEMMGIPLDDHIIIAGREYYSLRSNEDI